MDAILEFFQSINPIGGSIGTFWAIIPPIVAIALALITKEVYLSLFIGVIAGALLYSDFAPLKTIETIFGIMGEKIGGNVNICIFLVFLGIVVALVTKSGASKAYGNWASRAIKSKRGALFATSGLGVLIFVDDYFNCLTVGTVMSPVTDKHKISRAKLAYIIDATAAPVCIIAPISSWAAAVSSSLPEDTSVDGFQLFLSTIPFNLYAILTILMIVFIIATNLDFGPMKKAEIAQNPPLSVVDEKETKTKGKVIDLVLPIVVLIIACVLAMLYTGGILDKAGTSTLNEKTAVTLPDTTKLSFYQNVSGEENTQEDIELSEVTTMFTADQITLDAETVLSGISSDKVADGKLTEAVTITIPAGTKVIDTEAYIDMYIAYLQEQYTDVTITKDLLGITDTDVLEFRVMEDTEATIPAGASVTSVGFGSVIIDSFANCDSSLSLVIGSFIALLFIFLLYMPRRILSYKQFTDSIVDGFRAMVPAIAILTLAWTLSGVCRDEYLNAGGFVKGLVETYNIPFSVLPAIFFLIAVGLSFATGTSWGTFGILVPIIFTVLGDTIDSQSLAFAVAAILAGAVCGDHVSPISDTTILSSTGARCDHLEHVSTQMPYAFIVAGCCLAGYAVGGFTSPWIGLCVGVATLLITLTVICIVVQTKKKAPVYAGVPTAEATEDVTEETLITETVEETETAVDVDSCAEAPAETSAPVSETETTVTEVEDNADAE